MPSKKTRDLKKVSREKGITYKARFPSEKKSKLFNALDLFTKTLQLCY